MFHGSWLLQSDTSAVYVSGLIRASFLPHKSSLPIVGMLTHTQERQHHSTKRESVYPHFVFPYILYSIYYKHLCTVHTKSCRLDMLCGALAITTSSDLSLNPGPLWNGYHRHKLTQINLSIPDLVQHVANNFICRST